MTDWEILEEKLFNWISEYNDAEMLENISSLENKLVEIVKHGVAQARADEREKVLEEAIKIVKEQYYIDVTVAKLNQLKEEGK